MLQHRIQPGYSLVAPMEPSPAEFLDCLVHRMLPILPRVMMNQFGNYLCQKIIEEANSETLLLISESILPDLIAISLNIHGTRTI
jgi:hypothetical protein